MLRAPNQLWIFFLLALMALFQPMELKSAPPTKAKKSAIKAPAKPAPTKTAPVSPPPVPVVEPPATPGPPATVSAPTVVEEQKTPPPGKVKKYSRAQVSFEIMGQGFVYSLYGSYRFFRSIALNLGVAHMSYNEVEVLEVPISLSVLFGKKASFLEILSGVTFNLFTENMGSANAAAKFASSPSVPTVGVGYRYWEEDKHGFHFRSMLYGFFTQTTLVPWVGVSLGCTF